MPALHVQKAKLDDYTGELGTRVKCDFSNPELKSNG